MAADSILVLYVDDNPNMTELAETMLGRDDDINIVTTTDPTSVPDRIRDGDYDCIISDYEMPRLDGLELYEQVESIVSHSEFPYILFTGRGSEEVAADALNAGVTGYLQKGGREQYKLLANRIRNATEKYQAQIISDRYRTVIDALGYPVYVVDADGLFRFVNEPFAELTGYDRAELRGCSTDIIKPPETVERAKAELGQLLSDDGPDVARFQATVETADGDNIVCRDHMGVLPYEGDSFRGSVGILRVLSDQDAAEENNGELDTLHETAQELMTAASETAVFDIGVETARDVLGYELTAMYQRDGEDSAIEPVADTGISDPNVDAALELCRRTLETGEPVVLTDPPISEWDSEPAAMIAHPVGDKGVLVAGTTDTAVDPASDRSLWRVLTGHLDAALQQAEREQAVVRQNERLDEFASTISHELRNPLDFAVAHRELAAEKHGEDDHLEQIDTAHSRMTTLIEDILLWAREGIDISMNESVSIESVITESWEAIQPGSATLTVDTDRTVPADRDRFKQLFDKLFENAIDHAGDSITIRIGDTDGDGIFVADDGPGVPETEQQSVFESGYTLSTNGTGIGLALVRQIVEAHGWEIELTDSATGGARFEIRFDPDG
jgi:PAS domain S-box-containing protein